MARFLLVVVCAVSFALVGCKSGTKENPSAETRAPAETVEPAAQEPVAEDAPVFEDDME